METVTDRRCNLCINLCSVLETDFHLGGMYIHINIFRFKLKMQNTKREFMLHQILLIAFLHSLLQNIIMNISSIYKENFKIPVGTVLLRLSQKAPDTHGLPV